MKVLIFDHEVDAIQRTVGVIRDTVVKKPDAVLGLATGGTMLPVYEGLCGLYSENLVSFSQTRTFNLDEYVGLHPSHPESYHRYMDSVFFRHIDIRSENARLPRGDAKDPTKEASDYEKEIQAVGGIDLQLLGIGRNGHIGFNEPTSSLMSRTRVKTLSKSTRDANDIYFAREAQTPKYAITMGIGTILSSRSCVLLATGNSKANAIAAAVEGPLTSLCPASALQLHENVTLVLDREAASQLNLKDYYLHVHPEGKEVDLHA